MANVVKNNGGGQQANPQQGQVNPQQGQVNPQQPQVKPQQGQVTPQQGQRGELVQRGSSQQLMRDPFQMFMRDPFQLMREMMVDPFRFMQQWSPWSGMGRDVAWNPAFEIRETDDAFLFKADIPGIRGEDIEITLTGNQLLICGKRDQEQERDEGRFHTYERSYGNFSRSFALPESADLDSIRSDLKDGVLTLVVPKKAGTGPQRRKIQVGSGTKS